jgi:hypothetical protein
MKLVKHFGAGILDDQYPLFLAFDLYTCYFSRSLPIQSFVLSKVVDTLSE